MGTSKVIAPILLQRQCDGGKGDMTPEQVAEVVASRLNGERGFSGCWTYFQWWWGSGCFCPNCGRQYAWTINDLKKYRVEPS